MQIHSFLFLFFFFFFIGTGFLIVHREKRKVKRKERKTLLSEVCSGSICHLVTTPRVTTREGSEQFGALQCLEFDFHLLRLGCEI